MKDTIHTALQVAHSAVWSLHQSSRDRSDSVGHRHDAERSLKEALKIIKALKKEESSHPE